jgi:excisionase family DNA binding protein
MDINEQMMTPRDVAKLLNVSLRMVYIWLARKDIPSIKIGRVVRIRKSELEAFLDGHSR